MASNEKAVPTLMGVPMKHVSLITLTFQNSALIMIMHYSRVMPTIGGHRYFTSTAVLLNEVIKLFISLVVAIYDTSQTLPPSTPMTVVLEQLQRSVFSKDGWKLAIPASLYTLQNSLQYVAVSNLDAVHFQILYQLKILTTALFSVILLHRSLSMKKWTALVLLTVGVAVVQLPKTEPSALSIGRHHSKFHFPRSFHELGTGTVEIAAELTKRALTRRSATYEGINEDLGLTKPPMNYKLGCTAVLVATVISGLTGVYFEKVLKDSSSSVSVWTRNVQLSFYSLFPALIIGVMFKDGEEIATNGFFAGYNSVVWTAILFQAFGGVLVAMCINYADNIAKNFATSISIILSFIFSVWFFEFKFSTNFILGTALVLFATYLYTSHEIVRHQPPPTNIAIYEKTTIDGQQPKQQPLERQILMSKLEPFKPMNEGLSTSRPGSPMRPHSRVGLSRGKAKRED